MTRQLCLYLSVHLLRVLARRTTEEAETSKGLIA